MSVRGLSGEGGDADAEGLDVAPDGVGGAGVGRIALSWEKREREVWRLGMEVGVARGRQRKCVSGVGGGLGGITVGMGMGGRFW